MPFLNYQPERERACLSIFDSNTPQYFAPQEKDKFIAFLNRPNKLYFVVTSAKDEVVACGGYNFNDDKTLAWLRWDMVLSSVHQHGLGTYLTLGRMALICDEKQTESIHVGTSQHTYPFYEKMGFEIYRVTKNGIAPEIDEYRLSLNLDRNKRKAIAHEWKALNNSYGINYD